MYRVTYDSQYVLHDPSDQERLLSTLTLEYEQNTCGYCDFAIPATHPERARVRERGVVTVWDGDEIVYEGFVHQDKEDFDLTGEVETKGVLAYLNDSVLTPYSTAGKWPTVAPSSVNGYFQWLIDQHNSQVGANERFAVGINEGDRLDENNYILRESKQYPTVGEELSEKVIKALGGYVRVRWPNGVRTIDLMVDPYDANVTQVLDFGSNLLDFVKTEDSQDLITVLVPLGKTPETESGTKDRNELPVDITTLPDGPYQNDEDFVKEGCRIVRLSAVGRYGRITGAYTWDDVTEPTHLLTKGVSYLRDASSPQVSLEVKAVDLSYIDPSADPIRCGQYIRVRSGPNGFDSYMLCTSAKLDLTDPSQDEFDLGTTYEKSSGIQNRRIDELNGTINDIYEAVDSGAIRGEDATTLRIESSRGVSFKNNAVSTVLGAVVYHGADRITDTDGLVAAFGPTARLEWQYRMCDDEDWGTIVASDARVGRDGFELTIGPTDVDAQCSFRCILEID